MEINLEEFDPLEDLQNMPELLKFAKKTQIKNILRSYTGWYDPFSELLQNALDAVDKRQNESNDYAPTIKITINLKENSLRITDNGIGFDQEQISMFLTPFITYKALTKSRGQKGVGATYLAYGFNHLEFGTKTPTFTYYGKIKNGRDWVDELTDNLARPKVIELKPTPEGIFDDIDQGSTFLLKFNGKTTRPGDINWINVSDADKWSQILRIVTPLGGIYLDKEAPNLECTVNVVDKNGKTSSIKLDHCEYLYPHRIFEKTAKLSTLIETKTKLAQQNKDPFQDLPGSLRKLRGIYDQWSVEAILKSGALKNYLDDNQTELLKNLNPSIYGFYSYSLSLWKHYNEDVLELRKGFKVMKGGIQMATRHMIQGELIDIPMLRMHGYQKTSLIIFQLVDSEPDLGRKGFQPEIADLAKSISRGIVNYLMKWDNHLERDTGEKIDLNKGKTTYEWKKAQEEYAIRNPLKIDNKNFFLPMQEIPILSKPQTEQDVIVLFNQLLAGGVIRGIRIFSTSQSEKYDSICKVFISEPLKNHEYHETDNPLGIILPQTVASSEPWILEYKFNFDSLIEDFSKEFKDEKEIKIVVCWDAGNSWVDRYHITSLLHPDYIHHRPFHGATHEVKVASSDDTTFYLIVLSELLEYLNNSEQSKINQEKIYHS